MKGCYWCPWKCFSQLFKIENCLLKKGMEIMVPLNFFFFLWAKDRAYFSFLSYSSKSSKIGVKYSPTRISRSRWLWQWWWWWWRRSWWWWWLGLGSHHNDTDIDDGVVVMINDGGGGDYNDWEDVDNTPLKVIPIIQLKTKHAIWFFFLILIMCV